MYQNVLVATDGSNNSQQAVKEAIRVAKPFDATVHALSVYPGDAGGTHRDHMRADPEKEAEEAVEEVRDRAAEEGVDVREVTRQGLPHEVILDYIDENQIDAVFMGTHGRTGLDKVLIGSVAEKVVHNAPVPVTTVRPTG